MGYLDPSLSAQQVVGRGRVLNLCQLCWLSLAVLTVSGCSDDQRLNRILENKKLVVVTRNAPTTYYQGRHGPTGFEYELVSDFAEDIGVEVEFIVSNNLSDMLAMVADGKADIAAAGLTRTEQRQNGFLFSRPYQEVKQQVVCRRGGARPEKPEDLVGLSLEVPAETSYAEQLDKLQQEIPQLTWRVDEEHDTEYLLEKVWVKEIDCTIGDSNIVAINRRYLPELSVRFAISEPQPLTWLLPPGAEGLQEKVDEWLEQFEEDGELQQLIHKYYGFIEVFDYVDTRAFKRKVKHILPRYKKIFRLAAERHELDWALLAAQAYQESHWNRHARSPTGVRGIMMLTLTTAREVGIQSRLDPEQSILGGARYLARLRKRLPNSIEEPDRTWIALAAYNVGLGHIHDARRLAEIEGKNPDLWHDLKEVLPLLSQKKYYSKLKYGYARGREPVRYVRHIRDYHDMLRQALKAK